MKRVILSLLVVGLALVFALPTALDAQCSGAKKGCGTDCTKPCCADKVKDKKACGPDCQKACCADKTKEKKAHGKKCKNACCAKDKKSKGEFKKDGKCWHDKQGKKGDKCCAGKQGENDGKCRHGKQGKKGEKDWQDKKHAKHEKFKNVGNKKAEKHGFVLCPVMGGEIELSKADKALSAEYKGKTYYFCCAGCKAPFEKDPKKYLEK